MVSKGAERPVILVLAGVNGAGKSSVVGAMLAERDMPWFNPDSYSRGLVDRAGMTKDEADAEAWEHGRRLLERAMADRLDHAFETTLGASTIPRMIAEAAGTHDVTIIYCGLETVDLHIARVRQRVAHGGHDIPEDRIRRRWESSRENLIELLPKLARLQVFDNSRTVAPGEPVPRPRLVLKMAEGEILYPAPDDADALAETPEWAKPIVAAAFRLRGRKTTRGRQRP